MLIVLVTLASGTAQALSYALTDGTQVDPVRTVGGLIHTYEGQLHSGVHAVGEDLSEAQLIDADLSGADLRGAIFDDSYLVRASFRDSNLLGAGFSGANLKFSDFGGATLVGAQIDNAKIAGARFAGANLLGANFSSSVIIDVRGTDFTSTWSMASLGANVKYDLNTDFTGAWADSGYTPFDPVTAGWVLVPEPSTALLVGLGLLSLGGQRSKAR
jgi:uncharacterized protein YjbI with pentapeptide repeats